VAVEEVEYEDDKEKDDDRGGWDEKGERKSWALYFDRNDDGLVGIIEGWRTFEVELIRKERRKRKDEEGD
jgi:hypothetical protein